MLGDRRPENEATYKSLVILVATMSENVAQVCGLDMIIYTSQVALFPEEVRHGDITAGVKCAWNVITADKYSFFHS